MQVRNRSTDMVRWWRWLAIASALLVITDIPVLAQQKAPPTHAELVAQGAELAHKLCIACHVVGEQSGGTATVGVPTFRGIANAPGQSAARIRNVLLNPHPPMPDVRLTNPEIDRLLAYIDSLRAAAAGPPLVPRRDGVAKPSYPDPS